MKKKLKVLHGKRVNSGEKKKKKTLKYYHHMIDRKYLILFSWLYIAQKLDNSVKIVKITGHA